MPMDHVIDEAERYLVATCLASPQLLDEITTEYTDFRDSDRGLIFRTIKWLYEQGKPVTTVTVMEKLVSRMNTDKLIGALDLQASAPWAVKEHDRIVRNSGRRRMLIDAAFRIGNIAAATEEVTDETIAQLQAEIARIEGADVRTGELQRVSDVLPEHVETLEYRYSHKGELRGCDTGFPSLNATIGGYQETDLVVFAARPSVGKTAFMLQSALAVARHDVAAVFSLEMGKTALLDRAIATEAHVKLYHLTNGLIDDDDWSRITNSLVTLDALELYIDDTASVTVSYLRTRVRRLKRKVPEGRRLVVFVDYLQILDAEKKTQNRTQEVAVISRSLKQLAKEMKCCVVSLAQLSRAVESRQNKRPTLADVRDSGQIEQDADTLGMLYRPDYYDPNDMPNVLEVIIAKQRNGKTGTVQLAFLKEYQHIAELAKGG